MFQRGAQNRNRREAHLAVHDAGARRRHNLPDPGIALRFLFLDGLLLFLYQPCLVLSKLLFEDFVGHFQPGHLVDIVRLEMLEVILFYFYFYLISTMAVKL
mgnify:CR=1 FL=1